MSDSFYLKDYLKDYSMKRELVMVKPQSNRSLVSEQQEF